MKHFYKRLSICLIIMLLATLCLPMAYAMDEVAAPPEQSMAGRDPLLAAKGTGNVVTDPDEEPEDAEGTDKIETNKSDAEVYNVMPRNLSAVTLTGDYVINDTAETVHLTTGGQRVSGAITVKAGVQVYIVLEDVVLAPTSGAAMIIEAGAQVALELAGESTLTGAKGAGIDVALGAGLEIVGVSSGRLTAKGDENASGIGAAGGKGNPTVHGDITISGGNVIAVGGTGGAGIGTGANNGSSQTGTYKMDQDNWGTIVINGGTIEANGGANAAGIGSGTHVDGGSITINGGNVTAVGAGGAGIGSGLGSSKVVADAQGVFKGPGSYYGGEITITSGTITAIGGGNAAGIGGGMYCDSGIIAISGGNIIATGGIGNAGSHHHGGAGIGGGYLGHADVTISGDANVTATGQVGGAGIGSGGTPNANEARQSGGVSTGRSPDAFLTQTTVVIKSGTVNAISNGTGAGVGGGVGADKAAVLISGGNVTASGNLSSDADSVGGAGIGSGATNMGKDGATNEKYYAETEVSVSVTGGSVTATGAWGAAGIGSGANNITAA